MASTRLLDFILGSPGIVLDYAGSVAPAGFLLCYGQVVNVADYPQLYAAIGTAYGGDGTTTFGIPDCRGRAAAGRDNMGGTAASRITSASGVAGTSLGAVTGAETHILTTAQMPSHAHDTNASGASGNVNFGVSGQALTRNTQTGTGGGAEGGQLTSPVGNGTAHNNVQPTIILNKIIKT